MELGAHSPEIQIFNPSLEHGRCLIWLTKSLFSAFSLLPFRLVTNLPLVNLIKAASFHGYLQACSKVPFLRDPRFKQIAKHGPWHSESNLDPKSRMGYWGVNWNPSD